MYTYEVNLAWLSQRKGVVSSPVLKQTIDVVTPPEFPKGIEGVWSPEHFFVAAVESCLMTTFLAVAENSKLEFESFSCHALGTLDKVDGKYMMTEILLRPTLVIFNPDQLDKASRVLTMSEKACLITNSIKSSIVFDPTIVINQHQALPV